MHDGAAHVLEDAKHGCQNRVERLGDGDADVGQVGAERAADAANVHLIFKEWNGRDDDTMLSQHLQVGLEGGGEVHLLAGAQEADDES
eukprot:15132632-Heterocapsa_arctica.AAC.1